jgi:endonuclease/exonuclease/phosphatase family metal-dependent hydrolase
MRSRPEYPERMAKSDVVQAFGPASLSDLKVRTTFCDAPTRSRAGLNTLRVMTFNVRQPDASDGPNGWRQRRDLLVDTILENDPDVIGTQELFRVQAEYITKRAPQYAWFGSGRFGTHEDNHVGIFYKRDRIRLLAHGDFWLSETPETPGSSSWDIIRPRQLTWGALEADGVGCFHVLNTHFPYRAVEQEARRKTALLIKARMGRMPRLAPAILMADFNSPAGGDVYQLLCDDLRDAWCTAAARTGPEGTLHGFGTRVPDRRIDWILYRGFWRVLAAETITRSRDGRYPSDHFPVLVTFDVSDVSEVRA